MRSGAGPRTPEQTDAGAVVRSYLWGMDLSGTFQGAGGIGGLIAVNMAPLTRHNTHFALSDGNGNIVGLVNAETGTGTADYEYGPFGELLRRTGPAAENNPFQFSSKYCDPESGLLYYGFRYYSPAIGRWISRDPIEENGGIAIYAFVRNSSTVSIDPTGLGVYKEGASQHPHDFTWDNGYAYDPKAVPTANDRSQWVQFGIMLRGAELLGHIPDGCRAYRHYRDASGLDLIVSYDKAFREDSKVRSGVENEFAAAQAEAERLRKSLGKQSFHMTGSSEVVNTATENWAKAIGGHRIWGGGSINYDCTTKKYTMKLTISMEDFYNFNRGQADIATGLPDNINGRFEVFGWAKSFYSKGELSRTVIWAEGNIPETTTVDGVPRRIRGRRGRR